MSDPCKYVNNAYTAANPYTAQGIIQTTDSAVVASFQAAYPNGRTGLSPVAFAALYGADIGAPGYPLPWCYVDTEPFDVTSQTSVASGFTVDSCGNKVYFEWVLFIVLAGPAIAAPPSPENIMPRYWVQGFEIPEGGEGGSVGSVMGNQISRDASRTPEGFGLAWRNRLLVLTMTKTEFTTGGTSTSRGSWERVYLRVRGLPTNNTIIWRCHGSTSNLAGAALELTPSGGLLLYNIDAANTFTLIGTAPISLSVNRWYKIDLVPVYSSGVSGSIKLYVNGVLQNNLTVLAAAGGLGQTQFHQTTDLGNTTAANAIEIDFDDWINADVPAVFTGIDWLSGSHVVAGRPTGYDASHSGNWAGDYRVLIQNPAFRANATVISTTASARMAVSTDAQILKNRGWSQQGSPAFVVALYSKNANDADGKLGYTIAGGADVLSTVDQFHLAKWNGVMYRPTLGAVTVPIEPVVLLHTKSADVQLDTTYMLMMATEYLGTFGAVDQASTTTAPIDPGIHNAPYYSPSNPGGATCGSPFGQYTIMSGTYIGNDTGQDINLDAPAHWLYVRPLTGSTGGGHWWSSMLTVHFKTDLRAPYPDQMVQMLVDDATGQAKFRVAGSRADCNANLVVYEYVAVSDPGMRFMLNGAFMRDDTLASAVNALIDPTFYPDGSFLMQEELGNAGVLASGAWYKGKGHATARASLLDAAENTNALTFGLGLLNSQTPLHTQGVSVAHSCWRIFDGAGSASGPATAHCDGTSTVRPVAITSYLGDGTGARTIPVALNSRFPLYAVVVPHNGAAYVRDPSHAGNVSSLYTLDGTSATAITGGAANGIVVGATLNANGILYDVFVLPGADSGNADGWSANGTYYPVPPAAPCSGLWACGAIPPTPPPAAGSACLDDFTTDLT